MIIVRIIVLNIVIIIKIIIIIIRTAIVNYARNDLQLHDSSIWLKPTITKAIFE